MKYFGRLRLGYAPQFAVNLEELLELYPEPVGLSDWINQPI
jgi:hypothetical protein